MKKVLMCLAINIVALVFVFNTVLATNFENPGVEFPDEQGNAAMLEKASSNAWATFAIVVQILSVATVVLCRT